MLGSANIEGSALMDFMTGNLSYQIEHHLFPDLPSNRYKDIAVTVRQLADKYDLPYTTGPLAVQYAKSWRTIAKLSAAQQVPQGHRRQCARDGVGADVRRRTDLSTVDPVTGRRSGLKSAIARKRKSGKLRSLLGLR